MKSQGSIFITVRCPVCKTLVGNYTESVDRVGKMHEYRCPQCHILFKKRIPKKSNYKPEI